MTVFDHPNKFTPAWLETVLGRPAGSLRGFDFAAVGTGQVGDSYRVQLDWYEADAPTSLIAKCPAADTTSRETARGMHLYEIETQFYAHFGATVTARIPLAYGSFFDAGSGDGVLLLEDMAPAAQIAQMDGCSPAQLELIMDEAARLHGGHWNHEDLGTQKWLGYGQAPERRAFVAQLVPAIFPEWRARYEGRLAGDILELGAALVARFEAYSAPREGPLVLAHGDMRLDNMLFTDAAGRVVLLDWQTASAANPMADIAYAISTSLADAGRRAEVEKQLVARYHTALGACVGDYDFDAAWHDYRRAAFVGFLMALISAMLVERTPRGDEMFATMAERSAWQALDLDALSLI